MSNETSEEGAPLSESAAGAEFVPAREQPELPRDRLLIEEEPDDEAVPLDVLFVGGGPAGLAGAIELARLSEEADGELGRLEIGVLEKSDRLGDHCLSGAVVVPGSLPRDGGRYNLNCAVIVKYVDAQTRAKVGVNDLLRNLE